MSTTNTKKPTNMIYCSSGKHNTDAGDRKVVLSVNISIEERDNLIKVLSELDGPAKLSFLSSERQGPRGPFQSFSFFVDKALTVEEARANFKAQNQGGGAGRRTTYKPAS